MLSAIALRYALGICSPAGDNAVAAYRAAAAFSGFDQRDAALYWLTRLHLAGAAEPAAR